MKLLALENQLLKVKNDKNLEKFNVIQEPVDEWINTQDSDGTNILDKFYSDQNRWSFTFQMNSLLAEFINVNKIVIQIKLI